MISCRRQRSDDFFKNLCVAILRTSPDSALLRLHDGILFDPSRVRLQPPDRPYMCAYADGSIGVRWTFGLGDRKTSTEPWQLDLIKTWPFLRPILVTAARWPRDL